MKQGDKVTTPDGAGEIISVDLPESRAMRFVVRLDVSKYSFNPAYFPEEIRKASKRRH